MSFYGDLQGIAAGILKEFRQGTIELSRTTTEPGNPSTPWIPGESTTVTYTLDAVARAMPDSRIGGQSDIPGTLILASDLLVTAAVHPSVTPQLPDVVTIDGVSHAIKKIEPNPAAGTPVAFVLFVSGPSA